MDVDGRIWLGIVGKCLGPTKSMGPMKDGCKVFRTYVTKSITSALVRKINK